MSKQEDFINAHADIMTIAAHAKKVGWETINTNSIQRVMYLMKVLYSFVHEDENPFAAYHFNISFLGPFSELIERSMVFLISSRRLVGDLGGDVAIDSADGVDAIPDDKIKWIDTVLLILGKYGENKVFSFIINDPLYDSSVKANISSEIVCNNESETLSVLENFKLAFEETLEDTSSISKEEYISLYFDYIFSQIIKA